MRQDTRAADVRHGSMTDRPEVLPLDARSLDWVTGQILAALASGEHAEPAALLLLLRRIATAGDDPGGTGDRERDALGLALAEAVEALPLAESASAGAWLVVFSEATTISDDPRLREAAAARLEPVRERWSGGPTVADRMSAVEACLLAAILPEARALVPDAIDALERVVAGAYKPGAGIAHQVAPAPFERGSLGDHVRSASTLLTAFALSGRLPYAMLADELAQSVISSDGALSSPSFAARCEWAAVLCRLAALHADEEYGRAAVVAPGADYRAHAERALAAVAPAVPARGAAAAPFGLALAEWLELH